jgi:hypothetical protein
MRKEFLERGIKDLRSILDAMEECVKGGDWGTLNANMKAFQQETMRMKRSIPSDWSFHYSGYEVTLFYDSDPLDPHWVATSLAGRSEEETREEAEAVHRKLIDGETDKRETKWVDRIKKHQTGLNDGL